MLVGGMGAVGPVDRVAGRAQAGQADEAPQRLKRLLDKIAAHASRPHVIVAQICGCTDAAKNADIVAFNTAVAKVVKRKAAAGDKVSLVNQYDHVHRPDDFANFLHPNADGYTKIADAWFEAIRALPLKQQEP